MGHEAAAFASGNPEAASNLKGIAPYPEAPYIVPLWEIIGPYRLNKNSLLGPNSMVVLYMEPLGYLSSILGDF